MMTVPHLEVIRTRLRNKMLARLAMRWPEAGAYVPAGSSTVHSTALLADDDRAAFDSYVLGYQDAIEDFMRHKAGPDAEPQPYAMSTAEASLFQGGTPPPESRNHRHGKRGNIGASNADARRHLEDLFRGGGQ